MNVTKALSLLFVALLALACAAEQPATSTTETTAGGASSTGPNPCDLITEAEATEALEQPSKYRSNANDGSSNCIIEPVDAARGGITVDFRVTDDESAWQLESDNAETISGLGDVAIWNGSAVAVKKGDQYLIANVSRKGGQPVDLRQRGTAFAQKIVSKM
jgi:hypothetical protein